MTEPLLFAAMLIAGLRRPDKIGGITSAEAIFSSSPSYFGKAVRELLVKGNPFC